MKSPTQPKALAAVLKSLRILKSKWNAEPKSQNKGPVAINSLLSRKKRPNSGPDHF